MKVVDVKLEATAIKTICNIAEQRLSSNMLSLVSVETFQSEPCLAAFQRVLTIVRSEGRVPDWQELCADPAISEKTRRLLRAYEVKPLRDLDRVKSLSKALDRLRQLRGLHKIASDIYNGIEADQLDIDKMIEQINNDTAKVRNRVDVKNTLKHTGSKNNSSQLVKDILNPKRKQRVVQTGFEPFDKENGGFLDGSLVIIAADSGGGKCIVGESTVHLVDGDEPISHTWSKAEGEICVDIYGGLSKKLAVPVKLIRRDGKIVEATHMYKTRGKTMRITLENGLVLEGLPEHKVKIDRDGEHVFVMMKELTGSELVLIK